MSVTLDVDGPAAPPRLNGELVFDEPWESRSFAMAAALVDAGHFSWDEFREHLIAAVQRWEADPDGEYRYYQRWQEALEEIVDERRIVASATVHDRAAQFVLRPAGHDHDHGDHNHDHGDHGHDHGDHNHDHGDHNHDHGGHGHRHDGHAD